MSSSLQFFLRRLFLIILRLGKKILFYSVFDQSEDSLAAEGSGKGDLDLLAVLDGFLPEWECWDRSQGGDEFFQILFLEMEIGDFLEGEAFPIPFVFFLGLGFSKL